MSSRFAVACGLLWIVSACEGPVGACTPGASAACTCTDGRSGAQVCEDDGRFAPCACSPGASDGGLDSGAGPRDATTGPCGVDADCDDGRFCNGVERCDAASPSADANGCAPGAPPCDAPLACIESTDTCGRDCATDGDRDGDGHAAEECGGDDCDDDDDQTYTGASELCDGVDNDCNGSIDDGAAPIGWYGDCDGDTYAPASAAFVIACPAPTAIPPGCTSGVAQPWTSRVPSDGIDCDDDDASVHPGAAEITGDGVDGDCDGGEVCFVDGDDDGSRPAGAMTVVSADPDCDDTGEALGSEPTGDCCDRDADVFPGQTAYFAAATACGGWDYDCNGVEEKRWPDLYSNCNPTSCPHEGFDLPVACGVTALWATCTCVSTGATGPRPQTCR